ncbi:MAG: heavy metal translocating P-type ATPase, partial [Parcubacteria group bacterium]|nr:heavy metal translocating P-type ATPase [Parcubacteria group bacterium]
EIIIQNEKGKSKNESETFKGETRIIPVSELKEGDHVLVRPGGRVPADGVVAEGNSEVNEAMVTGESAPVTKRATNEVIAGTVNSDGSLTIEVTKVGERTFLSGVMRLVAEAQASKSRLQMLSDRAAYYLTLIAIATGGITFFVWIAASGGLGIALTRTVAVLVIACPHALGLAVPLVASLSTTMAARQGFLVKQRLALEAARNVGVVLFDKTGTLTKGEFGVDTIISAEPGDEAEVLTYAASVNSKSEHPIAHAIVKEAGRRALALRAVTGFQRIAGKGAKANIDGTEVFVGSRTLLHDRGAILAPDVQAHVATLSEQGKTVVFVIAGSRAVGAIALADIIREESRAAVASLHGMGIKTAMITGDSEEVATWVSRELGIDEHFARVFPDQKSGKVKLLQAQGKKVAMVGDGVNDAPALTQADLGIAIGAGTNVAIESAGIILVRNDPRDIVRIIKLSRATYTKMIQNLLWATGYNVVALPLAAGVLASRGILLEPALAALFMSLSTVIVAVNALMLRRMKFA